MSITRIGIDLVSRKRLVLIVDGEQFHSTSTSKKYLEETLAFFKKRHRHAKGIIKPFYAKIQRFNPDTRVVTQWEKEEGFSLWYSPVGALD